MDMNYKHLMESFKAYNKKQTTLGEHAHGKQCGLAPQPGRPQQGQLIWTGAGSYGKYRKNINN